MWKVLLESALKAFAWEFGKGAGQYLARKFKKR
jgi:hypothetical protein